MEIELRRVPMLDTSVPGVQPVIAASEYEERTRAEQMSTGMCDLAARSG